MEHFDFTEDEIREQLEKLGYYNVTQDRLELFRKDLADLVTCERSKNSSLFSNEDSANSDSETCQQSGGFRYGRHSPDSTLEKSQDASAAIVRGQHGMGENWRQFQSDRGNTQHVPSKTNPAMTVSRRAVTGAPQHAADQSDQANTLDTTDSSDHKVIKRKVLRKKDGQSHVCDESLTESESGYDLTQISERMRRDLVMVPPRPYTAPTTQHSRQRQPQTDAGEPVYRLPEDYMGPTALIRPMSVEPHKQQIKKSDPVARFQEYRSRWNKNRAPGEKQHKNLRWGVREHMLYQDEVTKKKQSKVFIPNDYVVPSEKKRKNLRWQIRNDLAQGMVPPSTYH